jgi:predicted PurR-regulated permease PerM
VAPVPNPQTDYPQSAHETRNVALTVLALGVALAILYYGRAFFVTGLVAIVIAFILEPFVTALMRLRLPRSVASFLVCALALLGLYVIGLGAYSQMTGLYDDLPKYGRVIGDAVDDIQLKIEAVEQRTYAVLAPSRRLREEERLRAEMAKKKGRKTDPVPALPPAAPPQPDSARIGEYVYARLGSFYHAMLWASFVPFLVYFMLSWRDHINRSFLQLFHGEDRLVAARSLQGIAELVRAFVVGNSILGVLLAVFSTVAFWLAGVPYPLLVGPLSAFLSLVPYVGLPLAMVPPLFAALGVNQVPVYILAVVVTGLLHLIALNVLYPKIVGSRVHLNPLVVTFSLMLWGFLWGAAGLLLAIPLTAAIKAVCDNVRELRPVGKFLGD